MRTIRVWAAVVIIFGLSLMNAGGAEALPAKALAPPAEVPWTYQDLTGPDYWSELDPSFATCTSGQSQSPIDLSAADSIDLVDPDFHYESVPLNLLNNGHTVQVPYAPGSYIVLNEKKYNLLQFHFHSPSEHAVAGEGRSAELHLVHQSDAGELAVVAVLLESDRKSTNSSTQDLTGYRELSRALPASAGDKVRTDKTINASSLLPDKTTTYRYSGSLTTPPCTESVIWLVMTEPISLPAGQILQYERLLNHNNRPLQSLNFRKVQMDASP